MEGSWRQAIFKRVMTPAKLNQQQEEQQGQEEERTNENKIRSREELRELWKKSIHQAVLLVRMEKENARIKGLYLYFIYYWKHF